VKVGEARPREEPDLVIFGTGVPNLTTARRADPARPRPRPRNVLPSNRSRPG